MRGTEKTFYLVRHCQAEGQHPQAELTVEGRAQADRLARFFAQVEISYIVSSPYVRAIESIEPTLKQKGLALNTDIRLSERVLGLGNLPDWLDRLERSFNNMELKLAGGESGIEAAERGIAAVSAVPHQSIVVTHGNLLALLLNHWDPGFGFAEWRNLSNPDIFKITHDGQSAIVERVWN
ncbi:histidine phosphatase family protein [Planococcus koreensis]|uniref:histidine phosphatase family protein n=1 Tax=Planococcus koreensis TaxID=112331 RepID=UPI0039FD7F14